MSSQPNSARDLRRAARQEQFLDAIDREEAERRFHAHLTLAPLGVETVPLAAARGRVLAADVASAVDVPAFDRSNVDGFAVQAADTFEAVEESPKRLRLNLEVLSPGVVPRGPVRPGTATTIATGAIVPRGADAVVMVEHTEVVEGRWLKVESPAVASQRLEIRDQRSEARDQNSDADDCPMIDVSRAAAPGQHVAFAGTDVALGETVLRAGELLSSREIGVLAAIGRAEVSVFRRPRVAIISTGDEIVSPGDPLEPGQVFDSNQAVLAAAIEELGGEPVRLGIVPDDEIELKLVLERALGIDRAPHADDAKPKVACDAVILSGGTSKGAGDLSYRVVSELGAPGVVAHGVALKPGKPICLAVTAGRPVVVLPGFPTSAIFTFHEFVAPVIRAFAGMPREERQTVEAAVPLRVNSERGRTEYLLVGLVRTDEGLAAYPMGTGSGSVTAFSRADGFITIPQQTEILDAGSAVRVQLLGSTVRPADLVAIGSHCVGLDFLLGELQRRGHSTKVLHVGSMGGLAAARRGECDVAGIHLLDPDTGEYNRPFLSDELILLPGYRRMQGIVFRRGDSRFEGKSLDEALRAALADPECTLVNRNPGSGTRILLDRLLAGRTPPGYAVQTKSHNAVAAAIAQHRADWGLAIDTVARGYPAGGDAGLGFLPAQEEHYDFAVPRGRLERPAVRAFRELLADPAVREKLTAMGFSP
ncbi:MAG: molybdopterin biosynthesis protein [Planctomycetales bacterium]